VIATKSTARDRRTATEQIEKSLQRLGTEYVDLWQMHGVNNLEEYRKALGPDVVMEAALEALKRGRIRHIGVSTHTPEVAREVIASGVFEVVQYPFDFVHNDAANNLVSLARKHDVGFIAMKPFAGGRLKDARLPLKYLLQSDNVVPDPGVKKIEEVEEIVAIVNGSWNLTYGDRRKIEKTSRESQCAEKKNEDFPYADTSAVIASSEPPRHLFAFWSLDTHVQKQSTNEWNEATSGERRRIHETRQSSCCRKNEISFTQRKLTFQSGLCQFPEFGNMPAR